MGASSEPAKTPDKPTVFPVVKQTYRDHLPPPRSDNCVKRRATILEPVLQRQKTRAAAFPLTQRGCGTVRGDSLLKAALSRHGGHGHILASVWLFMSFTG